MIKFFFAGLFIFSAGMLGAQHGVKHSSFSLRNYTAVNGLPQSQVNSIVEDVNGYLWMSTYGGGLARFDGQEFKVYTTLDGLLSNVISFVKIDRHNNLWIVHPRGITRFDGISFKRYPASDELSRNEMVRNAYVFSDTVFVIAAPGMMGKIYGDSVYHWAKNFQPNQLITRVHQLRNGQLCIFLKDGSVFLKTRKGNLPVGTLPEGSKIFSLYNYGEDARIKVINKDETVSTFNIHHDIGSMTAVQDHIDEYVLLYDQSSKTYWIQKGETLLTMKEDSGSRSTIANDVEVNQVLPDREGNVWLATNGRGLYKYFHQDFSKCLSDNMRGVMSVQKDRDGAIWIGTMSKGIWKIKNDRTESYTDRELSSRNMINSLAVAPNGDLWAGSSAGAGRYNKASNKFTWFTPENGLSAWTVYNLAFDDEGGVWIGTPAGLNYLNGEVFKYYTVEQGMLANAIHAIYYSRRYNVLFAGSEYGINTLQDGKVKQHPIKGFENATILSIQPYRDSLLLLGSGGAGFAVYNPATQASHFITSHDGLISDFIYFIAADDQNRIWVGTEKGISRMVLNEKYEIVENLHFDHDNGLEGVETNQNAFYLSPDEKIFGLIDGLYTYNAPPPVDYVPFNLHLTNVDIFYGEESARAYTDSLTGFFKLPYKPVFPSDKNHITFSFNRVDKRYPKSVRFKYRLKNYDKSWSKPSDVKQATYGNLSPGSYEFQVMTTNNRGSWSDVTLRYPFVVKAPFYQTASFIISCVVLVLGLIIFVAYLRVRQRVEKAMMLERIRVREQENLRKEIARDFHDEMGNQLTRIINYVSLLKLNGSVREGGTSQSDLYTKVENSAKYLYTGTRDFIWSIDPVNDELSKLFIHIRDFGEKLFEEKNISFRAHIGVKEKIRLPYGFSREVNLIFKEVMTNTFKYSLAKNATLSLQRDGLGFELYFEDDGIGFDAMEIEKMNGLKNIRERAEKIKAILRIHSKTGSGTKISLLFQFTKSKEYGPTL
ncbi:MAG: two-component regulator propeller domain-containing protein [Cyclobacteriaceae bacterium]